MEHLSDCEKKCYLLFKTSEQHTVDKKKLNKLMITMMTIKSITLKTPNTTLNYLECTNLVLITVLDSSSSLQCTKI